MQSKLPKVGTTIFTVMSKMANDYQAINLSQGFPNFPIDKRLQELYLETVLQNTHQYAPMAGNVQLLEQIARQTERQYNRQVSISENILITAGGTQGIFTAIQALVTKGDEVIILDPSYDCYHPAVVLSGAKPVHISLGKNFKPDFERIYKAFNSNTKLIIINTPHNPSGTIWSKEDFKNLIDIMEKFPEVLLLSDEVYEYITYEKPHISAHHFDALKEKSIIVSSFGKSFHVTGWKVGYLIAHREIMDEIKKIHQFMVFCVNSVAQATLAKYLKEYDLLKVGPFYQQKRDLFRQALKNSKFELLPAEGTYFQTVSYKAISEESDIQFTKKLIKDCGVATIPLSAFYPDQHDEKHIRLCYAKDEQTLLDAAERLCRI